MISAQNTLSAESNMVKSIQSQAQQIDYLCKSLISQVYSLDSVLRMQDSRVSLAGDRLITELGAKLKAYQITINEQNEKINKLERDLESNRKINEALQSDKNKFLSAWRGAQDSIRQFMISMPYTTLYQNNISPDSLFEKLVNIYSLETVNRDLTLAPNIKMLQNLKKYYEALEVLNQKYDTVKVLGAIDKLKSVQQSSNCLFPSVSKLNAFLSSYYNMNNSLKLVFNRIIREIDSKTAVNGLGKKPQDIKLELILFHLSSYFFNSERDFLEYPYIRGIVFELMKMKRGNPDTSIEDLINRL